MVGVASSIKVRQLAVRALQQNGRYWRHSRHCSGLTPNGSVANDPTATLAVHCDNGLMPVSAPIEVLA